MISHEVQRSDLEGLGVRLFATPPGDFDPTRASERELSVHGYPARPDEHLHPELHQRWHEQMSRPLRMVEPHFRIMPEWPARGTRSVARTGGDGWCGAGVTPPAGDAITFVAAEWTVPHVVGLEFAHGISGCAAWIGIDGWWGGVPTSDILQAGTTQAMLHPTWPGFEFEDVNTEYAWFQWFPEQPVNVSNFPVSAGDTVSCVICVVSQTEAHVYMLNVTTSLMTSFIKSPPAGHHVVGATAEWVLENPPDGYIGPLPKFGHVYFDLCVAGTRDGALRSLDDATTFHITSDTSQTLAMAEVVTPSVMRISYTGPS